MQMHRLFLALWPSEHARRRIANLVSEFKNPELRLHPPEKWHVTLHFMGSVPVERINDIADGLQVSFKPFSLSLHRLLIWKKLMVLEPDAKPSALSDLHERLATKLRGLDLPVESRAYRPHLTLGRPSSVLKEPPTTEAIDSRAIGAIRWKVNRYFLMRSIQGSTSSYEIVRSYKSQ